MKTIDIHTHIIPREFRKIIQEDNNFDANFVKNQDKEYILSFNTCGPHPYEELFYNLDTRIKYMDSAKVDMQGISVAPRLFHYNFPIEIAKKVAVNSNDEINSIVNKYKNRFFAIGTVPLQDIETSIDELRRIKNEFGFKAIQIGAEVNGKNISDSEFFPFYQVAEQENIIIIIHPFTYGTQKFMDHYYLSNLAGNPIYTTLAASNLIFSGIFEKLPNLKIVLCHGGGFIPYQMGRLDHGYMVRKESKRNIVKKPSFYLKNNFYFDTVLHNDMALKFLINLFGSKRVMMGSDFPYDMGENNPYENVLKLGLQKEDLENIAGLNASNLFLA